jgi:hypothetical protein
MKALFRRTDFLIASPLEAEAQKPFRLFKDETAQWRDLFPDPESFCRRAMQFAAVG